MESVLLDAAGHRCSPATMPGYHRGRPPRNKGRRYPADPPTVDEVSAVMRAAGSGKGAARLRALIVLLWRAGYVSARRSISPSLTSTARPAGSSSDAVRAANAGKSAWTAGPGSN